MHDKKNEECSNWKSMITSSSTEHGLVENPDYKWSVRCTAIHRISYICVIERANGPQKIIIKQEKN